MLVVEAIECIDRCLWGPAVTTLLQGIEGVSSDESGVLDMLVVALVELFDGPITLRASRRPGPGSRAGERRRRAQRAPRDPCHKGRHWSADLARGQGYRTQGCEVVLAGA